MDDDSNMDDLLGPSSIQSWNPLNDTVMGGRSVSQVEATDDGVLFSGELSLANGGGFASMQADVRWELSNTHGIVLRVRGDGQRYKLGLYDRVDRPRIAYRRAFETERGSWLDVEVHFDDLEPRFRGRTVQDAQPIETSQIRGVSILIADEQAGHFEIELAYIQAL